ncbi:glycosyltransferase family 39 protein [Pseudorhodoferax sp. Leaf267]|uniref:ArnT family glycosyltransferase n=1 Tax=Pseudorhodoferax sp. Leaf267 TaxID=1736316 RepID=UPI000715874C|nr:glycosyltransferase family 39 protein [Pseudorhodoferax sp. Leaf267]KQP14258.1 hypothetical protein ASF43_15660 [Pseudorhodoferax sp. Leaf267]
MHAAVFAVSQYALLVAVLLGCWGMGSVALARLRAAALPPGLTTPVATTVGLGMAICVLQALAIAGLLRPHWVAALVLLGLLAAGHQAWQMRHTARAAPAAPAVPLAFGDRIALACLALAIASLLLKPLAPPTAWDELMYHLPHAQQWADSGRLQVNPWLRYPWFPYNFDLLYAAALLFGNDVLPHLLHAAAGWLTAWLVYGLGALHLGRIAGCAAAIVWLTLTKGEFDSAYIDMGVTLFVLASAIALDQARTRRARPWWVVSGLLLGTALGSKYQVLALLPFFALALLWHERRASTWPMVLASLALPSLYWYARNAIVTGDPFNPIGGPVFGFTDWDAGDHKAQFDDLRRNAGLPHWLLWPALLSPCVPALRRSASARGAMLLCGWMLLVWLLSSRYPRYLMSAYPLLALLSVASCQPLARRLVARWPLPLARGTAGLLLAALGIAASSAIYKQGQRIAATPEARASLLRREVNGYAMWEHVRAHPVGRLYQLGLEDSLYYAPQPVWGEVFGPWRYRDVQHLAPQALHRKLASQGFDAFVIDTARAPGVVSHPAFDDWFERLHTDGAVQLYRVSARRAP